MMTPRPTWSKKVQNPKRIWKIKVKYVIIDCPTKKSALFFSENTLALNA